MRRGLGACARDLAVVDLAADTAENGFVVDPDVRFSLFPEHSPSTGEEIGVEH